MSIKNVQLSNHKKLRKNTRINKKVAIIGAATFIGAGAIFINASKSQNSHFQNIDIHATTEMEVLDQIQEKYDCDFSNVEYKDALVDFCIQSNRYAVNDSKENRIEYVQATKEFASVSIDVLKEKVKDADPEHNAYNIKTFDSNYANRQPDNYIAVEKENIYGLKDTFSLPTECYDFYHNAQSVLEYQGTGENDIWEEQMGSFSSDANQLFNQFIDSFDYDLSLDQENEKFVMVPPQISEVRKK